MIQTNSLPQKCEILQCLSFIGQLISRSMMSTKFTHVSSFWGLNNAQLYMYPTFCPPVLNVSGNSGCFHTVVRQGCCGRGCADSSWRPCFQFLWAHTQMWNWSLKFLRNCCTVFHSSCNILYSDEWCTTVPISLQPHQHLLFSVFC